MARSLIVLMALCTFAAVGLFTWTSSIEPVGPIAVRDEAASKTRTAVSEPVREVVPRSLDDPANRRVENEPASPPSDGEERRQEQNAEALRKSLRARFEARNFDTFIIDQSSDDDVVRAFEFVQELRAERKVLANQRQRLLSELIQEKVAAGDIEAVANYQDVEKGHPDEVIGFGAGAAGLHVVRVAPGENHTSDALRARIKELDNKVASTLWRFLWRIDGEVPTDR